MGAQDTVCMGCQGYCLPQDTGAQPMLQAVPDPQAPGQPWSRPALATTTQGPLPLGLSTDQTLPRQEPGGGGRTEPHPCREASTTYFCVLS